MSPRLVACHFRTNTRDDPRVWPRLAGVFRHTAQMHLAGWDLDIEEVEPLPIRSSRAIPADGHNTQKLDHWVSRVLAAPDGARILLMDADTAILRDLDDAWALDFDVALTRRPQGFPYNGGVVFLRASRQVKHFLTAWCVVNEAMLADRAEHLAWQKKYGGINQAALGKLLETGAAAGLKILDLPCPEWNCEDQSWALFGPQTRVLHVKSDLRLAIFRAPVMDPVLGPLVSLWRGLERESEAVVTARAVSGMEATP